MPCCQCQGIETWFNEKYVAKQLKRYHKKGPDKTTDILIDALKEKNVEGMSLLDIGGGFGAIQHELLDAGLSQAESVEASTSYLAAAKEETKRRGLENRIRFYHGDFVRLAENIQPADIVTLDRVICCYDDMTSQVTLSTEKALKLYALVYPRDTRWTRSVVKIQNYILRLKHSPFRIFVHSANKVETLVRRKGFEQSFYHTTFFWQIAIYTR